MAAAAKKKVKDKCFVVVKKVELWPAICTNKTAGSKNETS